MMTILIYYGKEFYYWENSVASMIQCCQDQGKGHEDIQMIFQMRTVQQKWKKCIDLYNILKP